MNDRIRQLAEQADWRFSDKITGDELQPILDKRLEKFAELIVKECAGLVDHVIMEDGTRRSDFIRKHFGVEE